MNSSFGLNASELTELSDNFAQLGYESVFFLTNMGSLLVLVALDFVWVLNIIILAKVPIFGQRVKNWAGQKFDGIFFNPCLAFLDGTFLVLFIMAAINVQHIVNHDSEMNASFYAAVITLAICSIEIASISLWLACNHKSLDTKKSKKRCGYIYQDLNYNVGGAWALAYPIVYQLRLVLFTCLVLFLNEYFVIQILLLTLATIVIFIFLGNHSLRPVRLNYSDMAAEFALIAMIDLLLICSNPVAADVAARSMIGWTMIGILGTQIAIS